MGDKSALRARLRLKEEEAKKEGKKPSVKLEKLSEDFRPTKENFEKMGERLEAGRSQYHWRPAGEYSDYNKLGGNISGIVNDMNELKKKPDQEQGTR